MADGWPDLQRLEAAILASNRAVVAAGPIMEAGSSSSVRQLPAAAWRNDWRR